MRIYEMSGSSIPGLTVELSLTWKAGKHDISQLPKHFRRRLRPPSGCPGSVFEWLRVWGLSRMSRYVNMYAGTCRLPVSFFPMRKRAFQHMLLHAASSCNFISVCIFNGCNCCIQRTPETVRVPWWFLSSLHTSSSRLWKLSGLDAVSTGKSGAVQKQYTGEQRLVQGILRSLYKDPLLFCPTDQMASRKAENSSR